MPTLTIINTDQKTKRKINYKNIHKIKCIKAGKFMIPVLIVETNFGRRQFRVIAIKKDEEIVL